MPSSVHKVIVPMAVVLCASHLTQSAGRLCAPSARTKFIIVQAEDVRVDAGQPALQSHLRHEIQAVKFQGSSTSTMAHDSGVHQLADGLQPKF